MKFWDSSALVPLLVEEPTTDRILELYQEDSEIIAWWVTPLECISALSRLEREGVLASSGITESLRRLDSLSSGWIQIEPRDELREIARRFLRVHTLRTADALQLAAAFVAAEHRPPTLEVVTLDDRLWTAADHEGFQMLSV